MNKLVAEREWEANRLQALAESSEMFAEASTDLSRLLRLVARRFSELVGEAAYLLSSAGREAE
jgi:hypothetical protein